ncbi:protein turtle homolog A-like [Vombatus ursinus]|uniref:protein turtle homolog A-like n=1 Tax=Vombatus ursinus TaxID=29139 RepID=UPI000FFDA3E3|nr:protein turtle homolog A-like [Vombatus ursinus]
MVFPPPPPWVHGKGASEVLGQTAQCPTTSVCFLEAMQQQQQQPHYASERAAPPFLPLGPWAVLQQQVWEAGREGDPSERRAGRTPNAPRPPAAAAAAAAEGRASLASGAEPRLRIIMSVSLGGSQSERRRRHVTAPDSVPGAWETERGGERTSERAARAVQAAREPKPEPEPEPGSREPEPGSREPASEAATSIPLETGPAAS